MGGDRPVLRSTATLACIGRRQDYFRNEFLAAVEILARGDIAPDRLIGSWAGAFGPTQFMPTSFKRYAVDFDHDGRRDMVGFDSRHDRLDRQQSENRRLGARTDLGLRSHPAAEFQLSAQRLLAADDGPQWQSLGVRRAGGAAFPRLTDRAGLLLPAGARGPAFLALPNFRVIMKYNPAEDYVLAIGHLADRMRGAGRLSPPGRATNACSRSRSDIETSGVAGPPRVRRQRADGMIGPQTRLAIRSFQSSIGQIPDGFASSDVLARLRQP